MNRSSFVLAVLMVTASCSKVKELDKRTESMERSTEKVSSTTDQMKDTTSTMYQQIRSKESEDTRDEKFQILMDDAAEMGTRMSAAGVFFKSLEFQLWTDNGTYDNKVILRDMYLDAANEFTRRLCDLYEKINVKKIGPTSKNKLVMSFYALAGTVHMNHSFQEEMARARGVEPISMYDLIKTALRKEKENRTLQPHEEVLLNGLNREMMIELIKARVDILSALALRNLADTKNLTLGQKAKALIFKMTGGKLGSIDLPEVYEESNESTKLFAERYLDGAVKAKRFLGEMGEKKELEKTLKSAYSNIDFDETTDDRKTTDKNKEAIKSNINELLK